MTVFQYCSFSASADAACLLFLTGPNTESLHCHLPVTLNWATSAPSAIPEDTQAIALPGGGFSVDTLHATWVIVATVGGEVLLIDQKNITTVDALLAASGRSGDWCPFGRVIDGRIEMYEL